jgi:hypothetical protein
MIYDELKFEDKLEAFTLKDVKDFLQKYIEVM